MLQTSTTQVAGAICSAMEQIPFQKRVSPKNQRSRNNLFKILILFCIMLCCSAVAWGQTLNAQQKKLQNDIIFYLKSEGFSPSIDEDGDIVFKKEGKSYFIEIDDKETSPFFLTLKRGLYEENGFDNQKAIRAADAAQEYKGIKVKFYKKTVYVQMEMFLQDVEHFKSTFYRMMSIMSYAMNELIDEYNK